MIGFLLRGFLVLQLCAFELVLLDRVGPLAPDLGVVVIVFAGLRLEAGSAWQLLLPLVLGRFALGPEGLALSAFVVTTGYLVVARTRQPMVGARWQLALVLAALLSTGFAFTRAALLSDLGVDPLGRGLSGHLMTALVCPGLVLAFEPLCRGLRRLPLEELPLPEGIA